MLLEAFDTRGRGLVIDGSRNLMGPGSSAVDPVITSERFVGYEGSFQLWYVSGYDRANPSHEITIAQIWNGREWLLKTMELYISQDLALYLDSSSDYLSGAELASGDEYLFSGNDSIYATNYRDVIYSFAGSDSVRGWGGNDYLSGGTGNDTVVGDIGDDAVAGNSGNDFIYGGLGQDRLSGGLGADNFVFQKINESALGASNSDLIIDFNRQDDWINLYLIDASISLRGNNQFVYRGSSRFTTSAEGEVRYQKFNNDGTANDYTMIFIDNDKDTQAEMTIRLTGLIDLREMDFYL